MRISSILQSGVLGLALGAVIGSAAPAFAETVYEQQSSMSYAQFQPKPYTAYENAWAHQHANSGVYDGPNWDAARDAPNGG